MARTFVNFLIGLFTISALLFPVGSEASAGRDLKEREFKEQRDQDQKTPRDQRDLHDEKIQSVPFFFKDPSLHVVRSGTQFYFEVCRQRSCKRITRAISEQELTQEKQNLDKQLKDRFRGPVQAGAIFFSETMFCTLAGAVIASVPGFAGGAMVCQELNKQKVRIIDLPYDVRALDFLEREVGNPISLIASGEFGEEFFANLPQIVDFLRTKYPL